MEPWVIGVLAVCALNLVLLVILLIRRPADARALAELEERTQTAASLTRQEIAGQFKTLNQVSVAALTQMAGATKRDMDTLRDTVERRLAALQAENARHLERMERTVDQRLRDTLSTGLESSFQSVSAQLEQVFSSVGEIRTLTADITDLKRVLSGVKNRGAWGEAQLGALLADMLAPGQYEREHMLPGTRERVDYAVRLPGADGECAYLPIDSKFPMDRYQALLDAEETGDAAEVKRTRDALVRAVREQAKSVRQKYVRPPHTTEFALLFLPSEGLYAHLAATDAFAALQQEQVLLCGPSTLSALLTSLTIGFKSLAIDTRSKEIFALMTAIRTSFKRFSANLENARRGLNQASVNLDKATVNSREIERTLMTVDGFPAEED